MITLAVSALHVRLQLVHTRLRCSEHAMHAFPDPSTTDNRLTIIINQHVDLDSAGFVQLYCACVFVQKCILIIYWPVYM